MISYNKGRGYIIAGILVASLLSLNEFKCFTKQPTSIFTNELYILSIGLILAAFNQVCTNYVFLFLNRILGGNIRCRYRRTCLQLR